MEPRPEISPFLRGFVGPWYASLADPRKTQEEALRTLLQGYAKTEYGRRFGASGVADLEDFQTRFPVVNYAGLKHLIEQVREGNYGALLPEPEVGWVITKGSTGVPKVIPTTEIHLEQVFRNGARAFVNFAVKSEMEVVEKRVLSVNLPSEVGRLLTSGGEVKYGYSSGMYAKRFPSMGSAGLVPIQEEIDTVGGDDTSGDWKRRFEVVYQIAKDADVGSAIGSTTLLLGFAEFLREKFGVYPKDVWKMKALFCTGVAKIHTKYAPVIRHYYGNVAVVEMYAATEGAFAQQLDGSPYVCPNYDTYIFEVETPEGVKPLHELERKQWGRIIVSSVLFPRYDIGDYVESLGKGYFRVFGRARRATRLEHLAYNALTGRF